MHAKMTTCVLGMLIGLMTVSIGRAEPPITGPAVAGFEEYDRAVVMLLDKWQVPGAALAIAVDGRMVYARGFGFADLESGRLMQPDTRFRICSLSKAITAAVILKLVEEGRLSLDDRAFPLLGYPTPGYVGAARDPRLDAITVHQLLNHTAGWLRSQAEIPFAGGARGFDPVFAQREIAHYLGVPTPPSAELLVRVAVGLPLQAAPGTAYEYANINYLTLGRLVELKTGKSYAEFARELLASCGITGMSLASARRSELAADEAVYYDYPGAPLARSHLDADGRWVERPYQWSLQSWDATGAWVMSPIEYLRFLFAWDGLNGTPRLLQPASVAAMRTSQLPAVNYGYGWGIIRSSLGTAEGHAGGMPGSATWAIRSGDGRMHWVVFFNSRPADDEAFLDEVFGTLYSLRESIAAESHAVASSLWP